MNHAADDLAFLAGGGEMGALMRAKDWAATSLGPPAQWPAALRLAVRLMLNTGHPMYIWWGPQLACLYNDAYRQSIGPERHPGSLGQPARQVWDEIWPIIGPQIEQVMDGRGATWHENALIPITRNGRREDVYWTYSYGPIDDATAANGVGGVLVVCTETTATVLAEQRQAAETQRQRRLFEQAPAFVCIMHGPDHVFEFVNNAHRRLFNSDAWIGQPVRQAFPDIADQGYYELLDQVYATGQRYVAKSQPVRYRRQPGDAMQEWLMDFIYEPIVDESGKVTGIFCEGFDVTERHRAEQAQQTIRSRQDLLVRLLQSQRQSGDPEAMMATTAQVLGQHLGVNRVGFSEILDADTLRLGVAWSDGVLAPRDAQRSVGYLGAVYLAEMCAGRTIGIGDTHGDPLAKDSGFVGDGVRANIGVPIIRGGRWRSGMYVNSATVRHWTEDEIALVRDVAELTWDAIERARAVAALRNSEQRLRELNETLERRVAEMLAERKVLADIVEATDTFVQVIDPHYRWLAINHAAVEEFQRLFGLRPQPGDSLPETLGIQPQHLEMIRPHWARALAGEQFSLTVTVRSAQAEERYYDMRFNPLHDRDGKVVGAYQFCVDVTQRLHDQARLAQAEARLSQAQKIEAIGQLTGGVAHDFNNLLMVISGGLSLLEKSPDAARRQTVVESMREAVQRGAALSRQLLGFARRRALNPQPVDLARQIEGMNALLDRSLRGDVTIETRFAPDLWPAKVDPAELELALLNLCVNARDAMPQGGTISIAADNLPGLDHHELLGDYIRLTVTDQGAGMEKDVLARVFEPFFTTKDVGQGSGLGLPQVYGFAQQSGGGIEIQSEPGQGTTVTLLLPRSLVAPAAIAPRVPPLAPTQHARPDAGMVLLVEDDEEVAALVGELLRQLGYRTTRVGSAEAALGALANNRAVDVVFSDVMMPGGMNGVELAREIRRRRPGLPILLTSGYAESALPGAEQDKIELLAKPYGIEQLAAALQRVMAGVTKVAQ